MTACSGSEASRAGHRSICFWDASHNDGGGTQLVGGLCGAGFALPMPAGKFAGLKDQGSGNRGGGKVKCTSCESAAVYHITVVQNRSRGSEHHLCETHARMYLESREDFVAASVINALGGVLESVVLT